MFYYQGSLFEVKRKNEKECMRGFDHPWKQRNKRVSYRSGGIALINGVLEVCAQLIKGNNLKNNTRRELILLQSTQDKMNSTAAGCIFTAAGCIVLWQLWPHIVACAGHQWWLNVGREQVSLHRALTFFFPVHNVSASAVDGSLRNLSSVSYVGFVFLPMVSGTVGFAFYCLFLQN